MYQKTDLKPEYHQTLTQVAKTVDDCINTHLEKESYVAFPEKRKMYAKMLNFKQDRQKLRAMAAYLAFSAVSDRDCIKDERVQRIISAVELENYSNYALNWAFDGKADTKASKDSEASTLASFGFLNDALDITEDMPAISNHIRKYNHRVHRGWTPEVYDLRFDNPEIFSDFKKFWKAYKIRNIEAGGQFYENYVELAGIFTGHKQESLEKKLKPIYRTFGEYVQMVNDFGDVIIPDNRWLSEKTKNDQMADLRNGVITLPIWLMYTKGSLEDKAFLSSMQHTQTMTSEDTSKVLHLFYQHAYEPILKHIKKVRSRLARQIRHLPLDDKTKGLMGVMTCILSTNKKFRQLADMKKDYLALPTTATYSQSANTKVEQ
jgi:hypothetical protein